FRTISAVSTACSRNPGPHLAPSKQRDADIATQVDFVVSFGPDLALVFLSILRVHDGSAYPVISIGMEVTHNHHAQDEVILVLAGTLVAHVLRSASGAHLGDPAK